MNTITLTPPEEHCRVVRCSNSLDRHLLEATLEYNMFAHHGVGLSAIQIGIHERCFTLILDYCTQTTLTLFNPRITKYSKTIEIDQEGCLSFPNEYYTIPRAKSVTIKYEDSDGQFHKIYLTGFNARVAQHEYDHLEGINFTERAITI